MSRRISPVFAATAAVALLATAGFALAQVGKSTGKAEAGPASGDSSGSFEVSGVTVDVRAKDAESARLGGWRLAQRKAWGMLAQRLTGHGSTLGDSALDGMVTGIIVEREQIGPNRYVAKLGVLFDRNRAASLLGVAAQMTRSPPMLLIPVQVSGGAHRVFEGNSVFLDGWKRFRTGNSAIDYVRPAGGGPDRLLMNAGQTARRGRGWWRAILDQYGADDVLIPTVELRRSYPGGPIVGVFTAGHGPDNRRIAQFVLRVNDGNALPALIDAGIQRIDKAYQDAMRAGLLRTDRLLVTEPPRPELPVEETGEEALVDTGEIVAGATAGAAFTVQFDTPNVAALTSGESAVRGVPGVTSASTTSMALGGISVMRVTFEGNQASLTAALRARGWQVEEGPGVLRIRRGGGSAPAAAATPPAEAGNDSDG
ncbi:heavy-metal-associated domain-containing protein [Sphingomonas sp. BT-65]|uniref:heavy-metal-associated domain-containing protein n=1 Tax=Sphingomonas sp. BT-65 TaxID=2989821 RepID=UPI0022366D1B|nr:heavy-metal-associated domain-containing protein [Sphingomonas sp. BT-65]MCW4460567.1 heavy-metal-associated domain-containing protein [Sphingomonas sp. BT-65]